MMMVYVDELNLLRFAESLDGTNFYETGQSPLFDPSTGNGYGANCNAGNGRPTCSVAVTIFRGVAYIAFADQSFGGLTVLQATQFPNSPGVNIGPDGWQYSVAYQDRTVHLTSAPAMVVSPDGNRLLIRYGNSVDKSGNNVAYVTAYDGLNWSTYKSTGYAPTQSALVVFNGTLYAIDKQDNSKNGVFVARLDNNGLLLQAMGQIPSWYTGDGINAVVFNGSIVAVVRDNTHPRNDLWVFSTSDGVNWFSHDYGKVPIQIGATPAIARFNSGVSVCFQANDSTHHLFCSYAAQ
jgi:hypothetical protein